MFFEVVTGLCDGCFLFVTEFVRNRFRFLFFKNTAIRLKVIEHCSRVVSGDFEPFRSRFVFNVILLEIKMKVLVSEVVIGAIFKDGIPLPFKVPFDVGGMGLFLDPLFNIPFGISDLGPAVVTGYFRGGIGVDHRPHVFGGVQLYSWHSFRSSPLRAIQ